MRVIIVSQYFWPEQFRVNDLAVGLRERGHQVTVLTGQPTYPHRGAFTGRRPVREWHEGVEVVRVPLASRGDGEPWRLALNYLSFSLSACLFGAARLPRGDVVLVFQMSPVTMALPAFLLRRTRGTPVVMWVQDLWPHTLRATGAVRSEWLLGLLDRLVRAAYQRCCRVLGQSADFLPLLREAGVPDEHFDYVPNWAEDHYRPMSADPAVRRAAGLPDGFVVMFAGNIGVAQALETLVGAAELLHDVPDLHWVVVGDGQRSDWLAAEVRRRGLTDRVHLLGRVPAERMPDLFAHADVLVATLRRDPVWALTVPSRVQSFLACGRPVVAAVDGTCARIVTEAGGLASPAEDPAGLAGAVAKVCAMTPGQRAAMGAAGYRYYQAHFERKTLLDRIERHLWQAVRADRTTDGAVVPSQRVGVERSESAARPAERIS